MWRCVWADGIFFIDLFLLSAEYAIFVNMEYSEAINKIFEGNCILFTGAGFSMGADTVAGKMVPKASDLADLMDSESGEASEGDLVFAADNFIESKGPQALATFLKKYFKVKKPLESEDKVLSENWQRIYTTNYDNSMEVSIEDQKGEPALSVALSDRMDDFEDKSNLVVHVNGSIDKLSVESLSSEFKLSESSYLVTSEFLDSPWIKLFRSDLEDADAIFFVGFSMRYDLDLKRIISKVAGIRDKAFFIIRPDDSESLKKQLSHYGTVVAVGREGFADDVAQARRNYIPAPKGLARPYLCYSRPELPKTRPGLTDGNVQDLIFKGVSNRAQIGYSLLHPDYVYYVRRGRTDNVIKQIENGQRLFIVHSDIGNGKTLFVEGLGELLAKQGYNVYVYKHYRQTFNRETEAICASDRNAVLIVESFATNIDLLENINLHRTNQVVIVTERTSVADLYVDKLNNIYKSAFAMVDLNLIEDCELDEWVKLFNTYGFWGKNASLFDYKKKDLITEKYRRRIRNLIIDCIRGSKVYERMHSELETAFRNQAFKKTVILLLLNLYLDLGLTIDMISQGTGHMVIGNSDFQRDASIREFIKVDSDEICVKSSILAEILIHDAVSVQDKLDVITETVRNFDKMRHDYSYHKAMSGLMRYSNLQRLFGGDVDEDDIKDELVTFYEKIRSCKFCADNPHYWLQYAILKLGQHDLDVAKTFFDNAYSYGRRQKGFDTYQIDNHHARYLLENAITNGTQDDCMNAFKEAHQKLVKESHRKDSRFYTFKVAVKYKDFHDKFHALLCDADKRFFDDACRKILDMVEAYNKSVAEHQRSKYAKTAKETLEGLL